MKVLVTGGTGYIGARMLPLLAGAGHDVTSIDCDWYAGCGFSGWKPDAVHRRLDVRDVQPEDLRGFDAIVHLAAICNDPLGNLNPDLTMEINHRASVRLARLAREAGVQRYLFASSCSMYGSGSSDDILDEESPLTPLTPYAESKIRVEEEVSGLADDGFSPVFLRNATAYGLSPRLRADIVLNNLVGWAASTGKVRILSDGMAWRPIVHIEDIGRAFLACLEVPRERIHNQAFNVGRSDENYRVRDIAEIVRETVPGSTVEYAGGASHDPRNYRVSFEKIQRDLPEFQPAWTAAQGAREIYDAVRQAGCDQATYFGPRFVRLARINELIEQGALDHDLRWTGAAGKKGTA